MKTEVRPIFDDNREKKAAHIPFYFKYLPLILYKVYSDLRAESEQTYAGYLWWVVDPVVQMAIYYVVFGLFFKRGAKDFLPFLFVGLVSWRWIHSTLMHGSNAILANRGLTEQVNLPKVIFPTISILTNSFKFAFVFIVLLIFLWIYDYNISIVYLALPVLLVVELLLITALTYIMAAVVPFLPDIRIILDNALRGLLFLSGIFYAGSSIPERFQFYFYLNPMANLIESFRDVLMYDRWPAWQPLFIIGAFSMVGVLLGKRLIARYDYVYPKLVQ